MLQSDETDVSQFDTKFTRQTPVDSPDDGLLSDSANQLFLVSCFKRAVYTILHHYIESSREAYGLTLYPLIKTFQFQPALFNYFHVNTFEHH